MNERRDTTEDLLRRRLEGIEVPPPPGVWERLEKSLAELPAAGRPVPRMTWWRRNRRAVMAAAACLLLMFGLTWKIDDIIGLDPAVPASRLATATPEATEDKDSAAQLALGSAEASGAESGTSVLSRAIGSLRAQSAEAPANTSQIAEARTVAKATTAKESEKPAESAETEPQSTVSAATASETGRAAADTAAATDDRPRQDPVQPAARAKRNPDWAALAMNGSRRREGRKVSASIFAGNLSGSSSTRTVSGQMAQYSSLGVKEMSDDIRNDKYSGINTSHRPDNDMETLLEAPTVMAAPREDVVLKHRMPITAGVSVSVGLTERISIESGLTYTYLRSVSDTRKLSSYNVRQDLHYVGIPLAVNYYAVNRDKWGLYLRGGGALEKAVKARRITSISSRDGGKSKTSEPLKVKGLQPSLNGSVGAEWRFARLLSIYAEPGVGYYIERTTQPDSYRTEHPVTFTLKMGLRVSFKP